MLDSFTLTPESTVAEFLNQYPAAAPVFLKHGMACVGCSMSTFETVDDALKIYKVDRDAFYTELKTTLTGENAPLELVVEEPPAEAEAYTLVSNLGEEVDTLPINSIVSKTIFRDGQVKSILFAFAPGQELSRHTAPVPAIIQVISGSCDITLGTDTYAAGPGFWVHMPAHLAHSITAHSPVRMLLILLTN